MPFFFFSTGATTRFLPRSFISCVAVISKISDASAAFCRSWLVLKRILVRKASRAESFAFSFNFEASVLVRIEVPSMIAKVTG